VEALTHGQWYLGGVLRSAHRYASDAMVVLMLIHLARHFAFDRMRGFRSFSWLTGVGLIWLVYVSGINGYMLRGSTCPVRHHRQLRVARLAAQFRWRVDPEFHLSIQRQRPPVLAAVLHPHRCAATVLLLMWVHVQRVPKASTQRLGDRLRRAVYAAGPVPVVAGDQPGRRRRLVDGSASVALDWFLLPIYPLLYRWQLGSVWLLVATGTVLLAALPWLAGAAGQAANAYSSWPCIRAPGAYPRGLEKPCSKQDFAPA